MELFKVSRSRYKKVYGFPTLRGAILFALLAYAQWFSIAKNSETERWLFLLMILLTLVHLIESSQPFRALEFKFLPFDPPFAHEMTQLPVEIVNASEARLELIFLKLSDSKAWIQIDPIAARSSGVVFIPAQFLRVGKVKMPKISVKTFPTSQLFRFWRVIESEETTYVLPSPIHHQIAMVPDSEIKAEDELTSIEHIRDSRFLPQMDQKLFLKTGLPYRRVHKSMGTIERIALNWSSLEKLAFDKKGEQFSFWIKSISESRNDMDVQIVTPFLNGTQNARALNWRSLKVIFATWFYGQS